MKQPSDEEIEEEVETEIEDEMIDQLESDKDLREDVNEDMLSDAYGSPTEQETHNLHAFLSKDVLHAPDRIKTSFLTVSELGKPTFSVRFWINMSLYCRLKGLNLVEQYCYHKAVNTTDTGLSREGFIVNTSVTQKKVRTRGRDKITKEVENPYAKR